MHLHVIFINEGNFTNRRPCAAACGLWATADIETVVVYLNSSPAH